MEQAYRDVYADRTGLHDPTVHALSVSYLLAFHMVHARRMHGKN